MLPAKKKEFWRFAGVDEEYIVGSLNLYVGTGPSKFVQEIMSPSFAAK
jgi:hypothetical protein